MEGPSRYWFLMRALAALRAGGACEKCGRSGAGVFLTTAHLDYAALGHEGLADVALLCGDCHYRRDRVVRVEIPHRAPPWPPLEAYNLAMAQWRLEREA